MSSEVEVLDALAVAEASEDREERAEIAYGIQQTIRGAIAKGRAALWELAEGCYLFHQNQGWLSLGYENVKQWLAEEPELSQTTYSRLISTWGKLHVQKGISEAQLHELELTKVDIIVPKLMANEVSIEQALGDAAVLGSSDLREKYQGPKESRPDPIAEADATVAESTLPESSHTESEVLQEEITRLRAHVDDLSSVNAELKRALDENATVVVVDAVDHIAEEMPGEPSFAEQHRAASGEDREEFELKSLNDASDLPWGALVNAYAEGGPAPRIRREIVAAFLDWRQTYAI